MKGGKIRAVKILIKLGAEVDIYNGPSFKYMNPLAIAADDKQGEIIDLLLKNGADPNFSSPKTKEGERFLADHAEQYAQVHLNDQKLMVMVAELVPQK